MVNQTALAEPPEGEIAEVSPAVRPRAAPALALGLLLLGGIFNKEVAFAVQTWNASTAYNHCFLVIPIVLYLLWDRRFDVVGVAPRPIPAAVLLGLPLAFAWLLAERLGIMEGRQLVAVSFAELLFFAVLGKRLWWALAGPLLYLYFLVPFGEFLTPGLQDITTWFIRHGLEILGIPAYIDGYIVEIPQGLFFVAEACAGLRFLIASVAFGCLYALMMYRTPLRRGLFILVSIIVPIIANGLRGFGIVYLGHLLGSAEAAAADHVIYGWVFFSAVILLLIAVGLPFREDGLSTLSTMPKPPPALSPVANGGVLTVALGIVVVAGISPTLAAALAAAQSAAQTAASRTPSQTPMSLDFGPDCIVRFAAATDPPGSRVRTQRVTCSEAAMDISWVAFSPRITAGPLMAERRRLVVRAMTEGLQESWLETGDGVRSTWRIMLTGDPPFAIGVSVWVDGKPVRPGLAMRAKMAMNSLFGSAFAPMVVTVTPAVDWDVLSVPERVAAQASVPGFLSRYRHLDQAIGLSSARSSGVAH